MNIITRQGFDGGRKARQIIADLEEACNPTSRREDSIRELIAAQSKTIEDKKAELFIKALREKTACCPIVSPELFKACASPTSEHIYYMDELVIGFIHEYLPIMNIKPIEFMNQDFNPIMEVRFPYRVVYEEAKKS